MKSSCPMPDLQMALLDAARVDETPEPEVVFHLEGCDACQAAVERLRRMTSIWMGDPVAAGDTDDVVAAAAARFHARTSRRTKETTWQGFLPFALAGAGAALLLLVVTHKVGPSRTRSVEIAAGPGEPVSAQRATSHDPEPVRAAERTAKAVLALPHVEGPRGVTPLTDGLRLELQAGESATVALANGQASEIHGPCAIEFWSSATEVGGWRLAPAQPVTSGVILADPGGVVGAPAVGNRAPSTDAPAASKRALSPRTAEPATNESPSEDGSTSALPVEVPVAVPSASPKVQAAWARAVDAQRRDDFSAADGAYSELCSASDKGTRDAARLARAQLWIARGRGAAVRPVLVDLAATGATPLIRQTARECLSRQTP